MKWNGAAVDSLVEPAVSILLWGVNSKPELYNGGDPSYLRDPSFLLVLLLLKLLNYPLGAIGPSLILETLEKSSEFIWDGLSLLVPSVLVVFSAFPFFLLAFYFYAAFYVYFLGFFFGSSIPVTCSMSSFKLIVLLLERFGFVFFQSDLLFWRFFFPSTLFV